MKRGEGGEGAAALVAQLRDARRARIEVARARPAAPEPAARPRRQSFDFATLPGYRELQMTEAAGALLGVDSPFFHVCEGPGAPVAMIDGAERINFGSYDYLGLNRHPDVLRAAREAVDRYGVSCSASRVVGGERPFHRALERALADLYETEDAVVMVSGHATNVTTIGALVGPGDLIICDELIHNSALEGGRISGAKRINCPHNDLDWLERTLESLRAQYRRVLIVVEGLYSMDGDAPDLRRLVEIKNAFDAWLMVDEAHGLGVLGETGRGIAEAQGVDPRGVELWMGTLSKTLAAAGGYICGSAPLIAYLKARAPGFVFSVGLAAPLAAAAEAALAAMRAEPERVARLRENGRRLRDALRAHGLDTGLSQGFAVTPVVLGDSPTTAATAHLAFLKGVAAPPILHPAVPERRARLRLFVTSEHSAAQIDRAAAVVAEAVREAPAITRRLTGG
ncbi:MAG: aminotransferase class I/II-fold pyridoxal phosphate-dependent enzyme [Rubrimonas sp.]|uniref:aminotransferase class I/II-fold pyridoxal phosphate-dependent enzyme n=1 Tax=Rubrimonas sp. TaxID=2036015 RepID=UPI002FDCFAEF